MIYIHSEARKKAREIVSLASEEITFFGFVMEKGNNLIIRDIFLPSKQKHTSSTTLVLPEGYDELIDAEEKLIKKHGNGLFRCHIHSHVNMACFQSGTDEQTFDEFLNDLPYYIAVVMNKKNEMKAWFGSFGVKTEVTLGLTEDMEVSEDYEINKSKIEEIAKANIPITYGRTYYPNQAQAYDQTTIYDDHYLRGINQKYNYSKDKSQSSTIFTRKDIKKPEKDIHKMSFKEIEESIIGGTFDKH